MGLLNINLNTINLDKKFDEMLMILLLLSDFCPGILNLKNVKFLKRVK